MAIKDWKLVDKSQYRIKYNKKNSHGTITIYKNEGINNKKYWTVDIQYFTFERKSFKTKQQALRYARAYMRVH